MFVVGVGTFGEKQKNKYIFWKKILFFRLLEKGETISSPVLLRVNYL